MEYAFKQLEKGIEGLSYFDIADGVLTDGVALTRHSRMSNYFQKELNVTTFFRIEKGRYHLITD